MVSPSFAPTFDHTNLRMQLIELWETFLMQLDADEDGEPFFKPPVINPAPFVPPDRQPQQQQQQQQPQHKADESKSGEAEGRPTSEGSESSHDVAAAATATAEQEE